jgi:hypothetical protein
VDKENMVHIHNGILFIHKKELNYVVYKIMDGNADPDVKKDKASSEGQILHVFTHMKNVELKN